MGKIRRPKSRRPKSRRPKSHRSSGKRRTFRKNCMKKCRRTCKQRGGTISANEAEQELLSAKKKEKEGKPPQHSPSDHTFVHHTPTEAGVVEGT